MRKQGTDVLFDKPLSESQTQAEQGFRPPQGPRPLSLVTTLVLPASQRHHSSKVVDMRTLIAIPVFNEQKHLGRVLELVLEQVSNGVRVLCIDDGSTDATPAILANFPVDVVRHARNRGYGRSMQDAFRWAQMDHCDWVVTMDCDEQHEPAAIPEFLALAAKNDADVISGSRYLTMMNGDDSPPPDRRAINAELTREINTRLGLGITDAFCGFKAYSVRALDSLTFDVDGYAFPMQFWVQAAAAKLRIKEHAIRLIYNDPKRTFGGPLNDATVRLSHYRCILHRELARCASRLPPQAVADIPAKLACE